MFETIISIDCAKVMSEFMTVPPDRLELILDFLCDFISLLRNEKLSYADQGGKELYEKALFMLAVGNHGSRASYRS